MENFSEELRSLTNRYFVAGHSNTADFILAKYILSCLYAYEDVVRECVEQYYGHGKDDTLAEITRNIMNP